MDDIGIIKETIDVREYYKEKIHSNILDLYYYCNSLEFEETPNYHYICKQLLI